LRAVAPAPPGACRRSGRISRLRAITPVLVPADPFPSTRLCRFNAALSCARLCSLSAPRGMSVICHRSLITPRDWRSLMPLPCSRFRLLLCRPCVRYCCRSAWRAAIHAALDNAASPHAARFIFAEYATTFCAALPPLCRCPSCASIFLMPQVVYLPLYLRAFHCTSFCPWFCCAFCCCSLRC